ncbi:MAG: peptidoglycan-binding protein [Firmicutes bacterium]|nr:peptidoglycan-binding protein [Bacillota bacterium]
MPTTNQRVFVNTALEMLPLAGATVITKNKNGDIIARQITDSDGMTDYITLTAPDPSLSLSPDTAQSCYSLYDVEVSKHGYHTVHIHGVEILASVNSYLPVQMHPCLSLEDTPEHIYVSENFKKVEPQASVQSVQQAQNYSLLTRYNAPIASFGGQGAYIQNPGAVNPVPHRDLRDDAIADAPVTVADDMDDINIPMPAVLQPFQSGSVGGDATRVREVFIPTYITVRLGAPTNNAARNVRVPFVEYIANVASSEIFATWPVASLEANIHAITNFALNRLFTEWYRSRGFNFDITNTTQFDQFFVYGRNIFENLMQISARIFNSYVHRIGFQNPHFTTYRANACGAGCLSQWGTVTLANQGQNSLQILRHFYGNDINITTTTNIQDVRTTFPGTPLRLGSTGAHVQLMQQHLNRIRQNFPLIPLITREDGNFGTDTQAAVREFQRINGLGVDGVIGAATWNRITQIWVGVTNLANLNSEGVRIGIGPNPPNVVLRNGSSGNDVRQLQWLLNYISQYYPVVPGELTVDGRFGTRTETSVREFQRNFGLNPDGVVGPITWNRLYEVFRRIQANSPAPAPIPPTPPIPPEPPTPPVPPTPPIGPDRFWGTVRTMGGSLNFRSGPTTQSPIIGLIPNGTRVQVTGESNGFYHIVFDGRLGWVSRDFVELDPRIGVVTTQGGNLNFRTTPNTQGAVIGTIPNGTRLTITDVVSNFYQTTWQNRTGFVSRDFVRLV